MQAFMNSTALHFQWELKSKTDIANM